MFDCVLQIHLFFPLKPSRERSVSGYSGRTRELAQKLNKLSATGLHVIFSYSLALRAGWKLSKNHAGRVRAGASGTRIRLAV